MIHYMIHRNKRKGCKWYYSKEGLRWLAFWGTQKVVLVRLVSGEDVQRVIKWLQRITNLWKEKNDEGVNGTRCKKYHGKKEKEYLIHIMIRDFYLKKYHNINSESKTLNLK